MNTSNNSTFQDDPHRGGATHETREWQAQERAIEAERGAADPSDHDGRVAQYRLVSRALRHPPIDAVPVGFATQLAARLGAPPRSADERIEDLLLRGLLALLASSGAVLTAMYGAGWARAVIAALPDGATGTVAVVANWAVALLACVGLSWALERLCKREVGPPA